MNKSNRKKLKDNNKSIIKSKNKNNRNKIKKKKPSKTKILSQQNLNNKINHNNKRNKD